MSYIFATLKVKYQQKGLIRGRTDSVAFSHSVHSDQAGIAPCLTRGLAGPFHRVARDSKITKTARDSTITKTARDSTLTKTARDATLTKTARDST